MKSYFDEVIDLAAPLIKDSEGCRLHAYPDPATHGEPWTIGWGHTGHVRPTDSITMEQAKQLLENDMSTRLKSVLHHCSHTPTPHQAAAMLSLAFNIGLGAFYHSTLLRKFNSGDANATAEEFEKWVYAGGKVMKGLVNRRKREKELFLNRG